jgi:outer membrane protein
MRFRAITIGLVLLIAGAWPAAAVPASIKIGYLDLQRIIQQSERGKKFMEHLNEVKKEKEKILTAKQQELRQMHKDYQQKALALSESARLDREQALRQKEIELKNLSESYRQEFQLERQKLQTLMFRELNDVLKKIGEKEGYTIILEKEFLLYAKDSIDITDEVIKYYNAQK